jgi:two-component system, OmpR family, response regulator BaeR
MTEQSGDIILVVEDDVKTSTILCDYLMAEGYLPVPVREGLSVVGKLHELQPAAILLDLNLPGIDGTEVCRRVREVSDVSIIMISARVDELDRLLGLQIGADDYVCKPFSPREVMARLSAQLRRARGRFAAIEQIWDIDEATYRLRLAGTWLDLTPVEFRLMLSFLAQPNRVFKRDQLLDRAHEDFRDVSDRSIDGHIKNLRKKLRALGLISDNVIESIYSIGYRFNPPAGHRIKMRFAKS